MRACHFLSLTCFFSPVAQILRVVRPAYYLTSKPIVDGEPFQYAMRPLFFAVRCPSSDSVRSVIFQPLIGGPVSTRI